ncbi:MAG TPA: hypothetical protein VK196_03220 [Magnetospirillum sp.]|nr:hypothetical protein [Magnetospirillum sp.]
MNSILILVLTGLCLGLIGWGLARKGRVYQYPFQAGGIVLAFIVPQLPGLAADPYLPAGAFEKAMVMTISCTALAYLGWAVGNRPLRIMQWEMDDRRLLMVAVALSLIGAFFFFQLSRMSYEVRSVSLPTGLPVAYMFFARLMHYGFAVGVLCLMRRWSWLALGVVAMDAMFYLDRIVIVGRRGETAEFVTIILLAFWYYRRKVIPRTAALAGLVAVTLFMSSTENYRKASNHQQGPQWDEIGKIDLIGNFETLLETGGPEFKNLIYKIDIADRYMALDFGLYHWNEFIFNYVPAQLVGAEMKKMFYIMEGDFYTSMGYSPPTGSTETGMADAFLSFWYLGGLKFFIIGFVMNRLYRAAMEGWVPAQVVYVLTIPPSLLSFTHHTQWIPSVWVHIALFLVPALYLARRRA